LKDTLLDEQIQYRIQQAEDYAVCFEQLILCTSPEIPDKGIIVGPIQADYRQLNDKLPRDQIKFGSDNLHFAMNVETLLRLGFIGIERIARENAEKLDDDESNYLMAIAKCHRAMADFMKAHADMAQDMADKSAGVERERLNTISHNCRILSLDAPQTFAQAVQLFWFAWNIRGHGTIGRLDQHLYPFYHRDLDVGIIDRQKAFEILVELWEGFNRTGGGDTLMNLMIGGRDHKGYDQANEISYLMMDASIKVSKSEPHLSARIHAGTTESFFDKLAELQLLGHGQGAIYNDEALIPSLVSVGVPLESACRYANDGCTEVTIDGESGISFMTVEAVKSLELMLFNGEENKLPGDAVGRYINRDHQERRLGTNAELGYRTGNFADMTSFDQVYEAYINQYMYQLDRILNMLCAHINNEQQKGVTSPFLAGTFPQCLETGLDPFRGGFTIPCYMVFSCSIPTVADGLSAIKKVVFDDRFCTTGELLEALRANFEGYEQLRQNCLSAPKFGNDDDYVDDIASDIASRFCARVKQHPSPTGKPIWPALYNFLFNDTAKIVGATPDGRRWREPVSEHYSPTPGRAKNGATAVIKSAAKGPLAEACGSSIFHVSLDRGTAPANDEGKVLLKWLVKSALGLNVAVMDIAIYDVDKLKKARLHPEEYRDLIVRVWGFSARFVDLCDEMQDHIIQRAIQSAS
jgi:pyruvate-formate lyase